MESPIDHFRRDGYVVLRGAVSRADAENFRREVSQAYNQEAWLDPATPAQDMEPAHDIQKRRIMRMDTLFPDRRSLQLGVGTRPVIEAIMEDEPMLLSEAIPFRYSPSRMTPAEGSLRRDPRRNAHVHHYSHFEPECGSVMGWLALEDISPAAGPMWISPGSHHRNRRLFDDILDANPDLQDGLAQLRQAGAHYVEWGLWLVALQRRITDVLESRIDAGEGQRYPMTVNAGDMILFDSALTHGTMPPIDPGMTRWSIVDRYQGRHTIERSWASWLGCSRYEPAIRHVPPASYEFGRCAKTGGLFVCNHTEIHLGMFWTNPLPVS